MKPLTAACLMTLLAMPAWAQDRPLFTDRPADGLVLQVADMEASLPYADPGVTVPKPARPLVPLSEVKAWPVDGGVALGWKEAWLSGLRLEAVRPLDLRPWLETGAVEFEVQAVSLARSGFSVAMDCGPQCGRKLNHVMASRALEGRGWQRLSFPLRCFRRDGADFSQVRRPFVIESSGFGELALRQVRLVARPTVAPVACPDYRTQSVTPVPLEEVWALEWWMPRHRQKLAARDPATELVFIGDSITHGWEDVGREAFAASFARWKPLNLGYGGDKTENVLWRLRAGEIDGLKAKLVVMMIGTNNTGDRQEDPETTFAGIRALVQEIRSRQPQAKLLLLAIFPRDRQPDSRLRRLNAEVSERIARLADGQALHFLDINRALMRADGTLDEAILPDLLHLSPQGYAIWAREMLPTVQRLLAQP